MSNGKTVFAIVILVVLFVALAVAISLAAFQFGQQAAAVGSAGETLRLTPTTVVAAATPPPIVTNTPTALPSPTATLAIPATPTPTPTFTATPTDTPTPTPTPLVVIDEIRPLGRLETTEFLMRTVVDLENQPGNVWERVLGTDQLLLVAEGEVVGGFDLSKIQEEDIEVEGNSIRLVLPRPEILYSRIDNERTYVYERQTGLFRRPDPTLETRARQLAEEALVDWAEERGIYDKTEDMGRLFMENFLRSLGFTNITIDIRPEEL